MRPSRRHSSARRLPWNAAPSDRHRSVPPQQQKECDMRWSSKLAILATAVCIAGIPAANAAKFEAKLASQDPTTTAKHRGLLKAAELIKERTNGDVEIKVFPSSQLGGGRQMIEG